eukprot:scpid76227/ scgid2865/ Collagen triple helix repeat-containing protein 1; Protein NMTC1
MASAYSPKLVCRALVLLLASTCTLGQEGVYPNSCLVEWLIHAGVSPTNAVTFEQNALLHNKNFAEILDGGYSLYNTTLLASEADSQAIHDCAQGNSASCNSYPGPCFNGGDCGRVYIAGREEYICKCRNIFYEGDYCETGTFPAYSLELEDLQTKVASLKTALDLQKDKTKLLGTGCNLRTVGYKYQSQHNLFQEKDVGQVASMTFTKKRNDTVLKLSYSSSIRTLGALAATRWHFAIDGQECRKPTTIDIGMWQNTADNMHVPAVLTGICESIDPTGAGLRYGQHTISVQVGPMRNFAIANANSGWYTTSILEVQELCPQF